MVIVYSTGCPKCEVLITKLNKVNVEYEVCHDKELMINKGFTTLPMLEVDDKLMTFKEAITWVTENEVIEQ